MDTILRITGPATEGSSVPAEVIVRAIQGAQQCVWLLAAAAESRVVRQRFTPDQTFRQRYTLRIAIPQPGGYMVPLSLSNESTQHQIPFPNGVDPLEQFVGIWKSVADDDLLKVRSIVNDEGYSRRVLQEVRSILPRRGDRWGVGLRAANIPEIELGVRHRPVIEQWLKQAPEKKETSVIGYLLKIDFSMKRVWILYPSTQREIECCYNEDIEDSIIEARHGLFQVTGQFVLDADGHPKQLTDIRPIELVDLSPVPFSEIEFPGGCLSIDPPVTVAPFLDAETQQFFMAEVADFGLFPSGRTRDELLADFAEQLGFVWQEYAQASEEDLTEDARQLRTNLLMRIKQG